MLLILSSFAAGMMSIPMFSRLPSVVELLSLSLAFLSMATIALALSRSKTPVVHWVIKAGSIGSMGLLGGVLAGSVMAHQLMAHLLPPNMNKVELAIEGEIIGLPIWEGERWRFYFAPIGLSSGEEVTTANEEQRSLILNLKKLRLSWRAPLDKSGTAIKTILPGDLRNFRVRLKRPRGLVNPGGFDYQAWLMGQGVGAVGYVTEDLGGREHYRWSIDRLRLDIITQIEQLLSTHTPRPALDALMFALLIGDRSRMSDDASTLLRNTGTLHLMAISGMHIGIAALFGHYFGAVIGRLINPFSGRITPMVCSACLSLLCALFYSALAGFSLSTVRAFTMLFVFQFSKLFDRPQSGFYCLLWALVIALFVDPLAVLDGGFWLSFLAVGCLLFAFSGRRGERRFFAFLRAQWVLFIGLCVPVSVYIGHIALMAPVANLLAIPAVSFLIVPGIFFSTLLLVAESIFLGAEVYALKGFLVVRELLALLLSYLNWINTHSGASFWAVPEPGSFRVLACAGLGAFLCLLPRGVPGRWFGLLGFLPLVVGDPSGNKILNHIDESKNIYLRVTVLDVGQGLAVHIQTNTQNLLYDTGPSFNDGFDSGRDIILPYLKYRGVKTLHYLIVSHEDNDHAGGARAIKSGIIVEEEIRSEGADACHHRRPWVIEDVRFSFLGPAPNESAQMNNHSCVLLIEAAGHSVLLSGDIERTREFDIIASGAAGGEKNWPESLSLMLAPHHGSLTSSSYTWLSVWAPRWVVFSAGFGNRYGHPHPEVVARYHRLGSQSLSTATSGALEFEFGGGEGKPAYRVREWRREYPRYWYRDYATLIPR